MLGKVEIWASKERKWGKGEVERKWKVKKTGGAKRKRKVDGGLVELLENREYN